MNNKDYRLLPVALHPAIEEALKRHCMMPNTAWQDVIAAWDRVKPACEPIRMSTEGLTDMAKRLRGIAEDPMSASHCEVSKATLLAAADECDRFYGGMMIWKESAQNKDRIIAEHYTHNSKIAAPERSGKTADEATEKLDRWWLKADGVSDTFVRLSDVEKLLAASSSAAPSDPSALGVATEALRFYAEQEHFVLHEDVFDTISGEPQNWQEDESNTIMFEDGSVAKRALETIAGAPRIYPTPSVQAVAAGQELTPEQVYAIRDTIRWDDGWDGDNWDVALANAVRVYLTKPPALAGNTKATLQEGK